MTDNFAIDFYGVGVGDNILLYPRLRGGARTRPTVQIRGLIIHNVSDSNTDWNFSSNYLIYRTYLNSSFFLKNLDVN